MTDKENIRTAAARWIDYTLLTVLSVFCFKYSAYSGRTFAETTVKFTFLNFPIFIGEFLLAGSMALFVIRNAFINGAFKKWHIGVYLLLGFIFTKAFFGYVYWGPLALRDAALFYYPLFGLISFVCYRANYLNKWMILIYYAALMWFYFDAPFNEYWLMPRIYLGLILSYLFPDRRIGALMALGIIFCTPFKLFIDTSRSVILGNFISIAFLLIFLPLMTEPRKRVKFLGCGLLILVIFSAYVFHFSGSRPAEGLLAVDKLNNSLSEMENEINGKKTSFKQQELKIVMLFNPNENVLTETVLQSQGSTNVAVQPAPPTIEGMRVVEPTGSTKGMKLGNSVFRILLWQDAIQEIVKEKKPLGIDFGKPFRSENLEIIRAAVNEWQRDGWIAMHNSYLNILYRGGLFGILFIAMVVFLYIRMVWIFLRSKSLVGILLCASLIVPLVAAFFAVTLELPYTAIPIWTLFGLTLGVAHHKAIRKDNFAVVDSLGKTNAHSNRS